jgi:LPS sulfotransferase NodH
VSGLAPADTITSEWTAISTRYGVTSNGVPGEHGFAPDGPTDGGCDYALRFRGVAAPPLGPEHDTLPLAGGPPLRSRSYVVCSTPRTGSGLLCRALIACGAAGVPIEYLNPEYRAVLTARWGCASSLDAYAIAARHWRSSSAGVFGTKVHWHDLQRACAEVAGENVLVAAQTDPAPTAARALLERLFPPATYLQTVRADVNRQAVSLWIAEHTGTWSSLQGSLPRPGTVPYSFEGILARVELIQREGRGWARFFAENGIAPLVVIYEDLVSDYAATIRRALGHINVGPSALEVPPPVTRKLADERSERLLIRFQQDLAKHPSPEAPPAPLSP